jgi:hypothetical protein
MSDVIVTLGETQPSSRAPARVRNARWLTFLLVLAAIGLPECCLSGSHGFGPGMENFGAICRARL